jgi:hypothetical protein
MKEEHSISLELVLADAVTELRHAEMFALATGVQKAAKLLEISEESQQESALEHAFLRGMAKEREWWQSANQQLVWYDPATKHLIVGGKGYSPDSPVALSDAIALELHNRIMNLAEIEGYGRNHDERSKDANRGTVSD